ncbi:MAG: FAD-dependent oxidoreductase [Verrucomicrobiales bacterium]|nr:FAD-dependent oxidoreductase [Verrucomicrobiales bacterium]
MRTEQVHTLVLGAGPSGLAAGYILAKAGLRPVVLEKDKVPGGLMRSVHHGEFVLDIGRKELYNRIARVDSFWSEILGSDYRPYAHRGGLLYKGHILDTSPSFQGARRGMPWSMFLGCCINFLWCRANPVSAKPRNVEEYFYQKRGRRLTQIVSQGFQEKLTGRRWAEIPLPENHAGSNGTGFVSTVRDALKRAFSTKEVNTFMGIWKHPAKGSGQISELLAEGIVKAGGCIEYQAKVLGMAAADGLISSVNVEVPSGSVLYKTAQVVSSIPPEILKRFLFPPDSAANDGSKAGHGFPSEKRKGAAPQRTVVLVYVFLNEAPLFPHAWLNVTCPTTRIGRITNYSAFNGDMVPSHKTCLCCEFYCFGPDPLLDMQDKDIAQLALDDCARSGLLNPHMCFDRVVLRFPGADASQNRDNWMSEKRLKLLAELEQFKNLYYVNRTETDIATLAGLEAGEAILSGDRTRFDRRIDPTELGIRSETKAFEFQLPISVES